MLEETDECKLDAHQALVSFYDGRNYKRNKTNIKQPIEQDGWMFKNVPQKDMKWNFFMHII